LGGFFLWHAARFGIKADIFLLVAKKKTKQTIVCLSLDYRSFYCKGDPDEIAAFSSALVRAIDETRSKVGAAPYPPFFSLVFIFRSRSELTRLSLLSFSFFAPRQLAKQRLVRTMSSSDCAIM
jgi:hypothetical protein